MQYIDLTHTFTPAMPVFPGDPAAELDEVSTVAKDGILHYEVKTGMHVGTHMDAPAHMLEGGKFLDQYPPVKFFGRGVVLDAQGKSAADVNLLDQQQIQKGDIVLVCFGWSSEFQNEQYYLNYPEIKEGLARKLAELEVSIVGMDTPSPDRAPYVTHKILFEKDILIIENLNNLEALLKFKSFEIAALPAKFKAEAAPCRVVARIN